MSPENILNKHTLGEGVFKLAPKKIFWEDPYLTKLDATILQVNGNQVIVDQTIFYAFSGGQESDHGNFSDKRVLEARKEGRQIFYTLEENHGLKPGDVITMSIDWDRRYRLMRLHFAAEVVLEIIYKNYPPVAKVGAHIAQDKARIDFIWDQNVSSIIPILQNEAQKIIDSNQEIISAFSDIENERRYWKINEFSKVPCGGTHIKRTGEIGKLQLKRVNPGKGRERIEIYVD